MKLIEIMPGTYIEKAVAQMVTIAANNGEHIQAYFNDILLTAMPFESPQKILERYAQEVDNRQAEYRAKKRERNT